MFQCSRSILRASNHYNYTKSITSAMAGFSSTKPLFVILDKSSDMCRSLTTLPSTTKDRVHDEALDELLLSIKNDPSSFNKICISYIYKLCKSGNLLTAAKLLQSLRNNQIFFSSKAYDHILAAASEKSDIGLVAQVFKNLIVSGEILSSKSYLSFAKAFMNTDDNLLLTKFIIEILELNFKGGVTVINRIIYAFATCKQFDKALLIFDHMKNMNCKPDQITYNIVLDLLGRAGRVDEMLNEFASMKEDNVVPDIISYNTLINSLRKVGRLGLCLVFFKELVQIGIEPDLRTYTALIESFGRTGNIEGSVTLFSEMKERLICPSIYVYRSLINNSKKMGKIELATKLSEEMNSCLSDLVGPKDFKKKNR